MDLPANVAKAFTQFRTAEFGTLARDGVPVAVPLSPLWQPAKERFLVTTGIGLPYKAYHARRWPRVSLLMSNPTGSGLADPPAVLVQGDATVSDLTTWDEDLAEFWPWLLARQPVSTTGAAGLFYRYGVPWYYQRLKIHVVPRRIRYWPGLDMAGTPQEVILPAGAGTPAAPKPPPPGPAAPGDAAAFCRLARAAGRFPVPRLTVLDASGYPASTLCPAVPDSGDRVLRLDVPGWLGVSAGPASLMSHRHDEKLWNLAGFLARGVLEADDTGWLFRPTAYVAFGTKPAEVLAFIRGSRRAARAHLQRRRTPPPPVPWDKLAAARNKARHGA
jgi:hypothetical protein